MRVTSVQERFVMPAKAGIQRSCKSNCVLKKPMRVRRQKLENVDASLRWHDKAMPLKCFAFLVLIFVGNIYADHAVIEFPIAFDTTQTPSLSTELRVGAGLGFTHYFFDFHSLHLGYGFGVMFLPSFWRGTQKVYSVGFDSEFAGRFHLAYSFDGTTFSFWPYVFIGPDVQLKFTKLNVFEDSDRVYTFDFGFLGGIGIKTQLGGFEVKTDTAAGYGLSGVNLRTTIMFGFGIF